MALYNSRKRGGLGQGQKHAAGRFMQSEMVEQAGMWGPWNGEEGN